MEDGECCHQLINDFNFALGFHWRKFQIIVVILICMFMLCCLKMCFDFIRYCTEIQTQHLQGYMKYEVKGKRGLERKL